MAQSWTIYVCHTDYIGDGPLAWQDLAVGRWEDKIRSWGLRSISSWTYFVRKKIDLFLGTKNLYFIYALDHHHHSFLSISPFSSFYCVWVKSTWMVRYMCNLTLLPTEHAKTTYFQISFSIFLNIPIFQPHALLVRVVITWKFANRRGRGNKKPRESREGPTKASWISHSGRCGVHLTGERRCGPLGQDARITVTSRCRLIDVSKWWAHCRLAART